MQYLYGAGAADVMVARGNETLALLDDSGTVTSDTGYVLAEYSASAPLNVYDAETDGSQITTGLLAADGVTSITQVEPDDLGRIRFYAPDGETGTLWLATDAVSTRYAVQPADLATIVSRGVVDVRTFGAVGDGATDDTAAIQAALAAAAGGGIVTGGGATYAVSSDGATFQWSSYAGVTVRDLTFLKTGTAQSIWHQWTATADDVTLERVTFDDTSGLTTYPVYINGASDVTFNHCSTVRPNTANYSVGIAEAERPVFNSCHFDGGYTSFYILPRNSTGIVLRDCRFTNWRYRAIYGLANASGGASDVTIDGCIIDCSHVTSLDPADARQPIVTEGTISSGYSLSNVKIVNNVIVGPGTAYGDAVTPGTADQISPKHVDGLVVAGNIVTHGGDGGIILTDCRNATIAHNVCDNNDVRGIFVGNGSTDVAIVGNSCANNGQDWGGTLTDANRVGIAVSGTLDARGVFRVTIVGNSLTDSGGDTQKYGLRIADATNVYIGPNNYAGCSGGPLVTTGTNSILGGGFYGAAPVAKPTVTGSTGANAALSSLLTALATLGLITNSTT